MREYLLGLSKATITNESTQVDSPNKEEKLR
jgi:hypothetical protein